MRSEKEGFEQLSDLSELTKRSERGRKGLNIEIEKMKKIDAQKKKRQPSNDKPQISK